MSEAMHKLHKAKELIDEALAELQVSDEELDKASQEAALDRFEGIAKGQSPNPLTIMEIREIVRNELLKVDDKPDIDHAEFFDNKVAVNTLKRLVRHEIEKAAKAEGDE